jgi:hypothetical protein
MTDREAVRMMARMRREKMRTEPLVVYFGLVSIDKCDRKYGAVMSWKKISNF